MNTPNSSVLNMILNEMNVSIRIITKDASILYSNAVFNSIFGLESNEILNLKSDDKVFKSFATAARNALNQFDEEIIKSVEFIQRDLTGIKKFYDASYRKLEIQDDQIVLLETVRDITQKKVFDKEMMQREKLASIGQVASSFAHEIKNPLTGIRLGLNLIKDDITDTQILDGIYNDVKRLDKILDLLLNYAKVKDKIKQQTDINKLIDKSLILLRKQAEHLNVNIETEFSPIIPQLRVDQDEIQQVIINIVLNAMQSIMGSGKIEIKTSNATITETLGVLITIQDSGEGIDDQIIHKINNLFFTTKEDGTGLGLPMSQKIIREHGGSIVFESEKGEGTLVKIFIPIEI